MPKHFDLGHPDANRAVNFAIDELDPAPPSWWWLSFADDTGFLGGCLVKASNTGTALRRTWELGVNPGGSVASWGPFTDDHVDQAFPPHKRHRLLSRSEIE